MVLYLHPHYSTGALAQLVEQWTENPCVPGSIPGGTTEKTRTYLFGFFVLKLFFSQILFYKSCSFVLAPIAVTAFFEER